MTGKHQADGCSSTIFKDDEQNLCKIRIQADLSSIHPNANYKEKGIFSFVCKIAGCSSLSDDINWQLLDSDGKYENESEGILCRMCFWQFDFIR